MKQPTRTLPQAVKLFPKSWSEVLNNTIPDNFYNLTWEQKYKTYSDSHNCVYYCSNKDGKIFFGLRAKTICRSGNKFYPKIDWTNTIVIDGRKIFTNKLSLIGLRKFLSIIGIDLKFENNLPESLQTCLLKECVIADILRKKVYNEETLCRCVLSKIYHLKGFDWKLFFKYKDCSNYLSIPDLQSFTKDLVKSMSVLVHDVHYNPIYRDLLDSAIQLNEVVDFTWSERRMREEHQRQINELNRREIEEKEQVPIFDVCLDEPHIHMLNTEKEVFLEGTNMHHCLYNCYWNRIKRKDYIAFHMFVPEDCTFSFKILNDKVILDQAFLAYDKQISDITRAAIVDFQNRNEADLYKLLTGENKCDWPEEEIDLLY